MEGASIGEFTLRSPRPASPTATSQCPTLSGVFCRGLDVTGSREALTPSERDLCGAGHPTPTCQLVLTI